MGLHKDCNDCPDHNTCPIVEFVGETRKHAEDIKNILESHKDLFTYVAFRYASSSLPTMLASAEELREHDDAVMALTYCILTHANGSLANRTIPCLTAERLKANAESN